jgi:hypothetical protein
VEKKIRCLKPEEIEIRVQQITEKGAQLLLYKDSRCDKRILDETFGIFGWKDRYEEIKGNLFCTISIYDEAEQQWIDKCDCGTETFSEKEKGEASDAFKRAGFNVGIGRELYTRIFYFASVPTKKNDKGKYDLANKYEKFTVAEISTNEETEKIEKIKIADSKGNIVFSYGYPKTTAKKEEIKKMDKPVEMIEEGQITAIRILLKDHEELKKAVYKKLGITSSTEMPSKLTKAQGTSLIKQLKAKVGE